MNMHWLRNTLIVLALLTPPGMSAAAAEASQVRPFTEHGVVDSGLQEGMLVISDTVYHVTDQTQIHKLNGKPATMGDLKHGVKVGFNMYGTRAMRYLSDIWILPSSFNFDSLADE